MKKSFGRKRGEWLQEGKGGGVGEGRRQQQIGMIDLGVGGGGRVGRMQMHGEQGPLAGTGVGEQCQSFSVRESKGKEL